MAGANWVVARLLLTWQKIIPLFFIVLNRVGLRGEVVYLLGAVNAVVGGVGGLNQTRFRPLLAYSSIGHMGWMIVAGRLASGLFFFYFFLYILLNLGIIFLLGVVNIKGVGASLLRKNFLVYFSLVVCLISLGGIPPLLGFFPKWMVLRKLNFLSVPLLMVLGSLINLFYYIRICFSIYIRSRNYLTRVGRFSSGGLILRGLFIFGNFGFPVLMLL